MTKDEKLAVYKEIKRKRFKPGEKCLLSGQYSDTEGQQITMIKGRKFPPDAHSKMRWQISDYTR